MCLSNNCLFDKQQKITNGGWGMSNLEIRKKFCQMQSKIINLQMLSELTKVLLAYGYVQSLMMNAEIGLKKHSTN